jgi:hypothetical protein
MRDQCAGGVSPLNQGRDGPATLLNPQFPLPSQQNPQKNRRRRNPDSPETIIISR